MLKNHHLTQLSSGNSGCGTGRSFASCYVSFHADFFSLLLGYLEIKKKKKTSTYRCLSKRQTIPN